MLNVRTYIEFVLDLGTSKVKVRLVVEELVEIGFTRSNIGSVPCITTIHRFLGRKISIKENGLWLDAFFSKSAPLIYLPSLLVFLSIHKSFDMNRSWIWPLRSTGTIHFGHWCEKEQNPEWFSALKFDMKTVVNLGNARSVIFTYFPP